MSAFRWAVRALLRWAPLFLTLAAVITVTVLVYDLAAKAFPGNSPAVAGVMLTVVLFFAFGGTAADAIRRKITVTRPVERILEATERIAAGDFSVRLDISRPHAAYNGYDRIMDNINRMAAELSASDTVGRDFVSNVSHEFKTPLAVIQNYAAALQNEGLDDETRARYTDVLVATSRRLTELVTNILRLNKLESRQLRTAREPVRLDESIAQVVLSFEDAIEEKNIALDCDLDEMTVLSDAGCLGVVWSNLLSNAVKFTEPGGRVRVTLRRENGCAVVAVEDSGCGISAETGRHIFDKFYQGDTSHAQEGNGLGLALVKKVIDILGGDISVESEEGRGSTFTVRLRGDG